MITIEDLYASSSKKFCEDSLKAYKEAGRLEEFMSVRRHPDTCLSRVLSLVEADALWETRHTPPSLLGDMGMCVYAFGDILEPTHAFLIDDSQFGWETLKKKGWHACSFKFRGTAHREFNTWREHVAHFYSPETKVIESTDELIAFLNGG